MIVRWGLEELPAALAELGAVRPFVIASPRWESLDLPIERGHPDPAYTGPCPPHRQFRSGKPAFPQELVDALGSHVQDRGHLRVTYGSRPENDRFLAALDEVIAQVPASA